jgi:FkbM family methyltransferase
LINFSAIRPESLAGKLVRYPFRMLPPDLTVPVLQGPLQGLRWIVGSHLHGCWLGSYEWKTQRLLAANLKSSGVFYDVGANVGFYSLLAAKIIAPGQVYAFEPLPSNLVYLRKHLEMNRIENVEVIQMAVCDRVGEALFRTEKTRAMGRIESDGNLSVQASTLDSLLEQERISPPNYIKMDIEGSEFQALLGARGCFDRYRPKLFLATHGVNVHDNCCQLLNSWNYEFYYTARESADRAEMFAWHRSAE